MNPKLIINLFKLRTNLDRLVDRCHAVGIKTAIVTKVFCADERICRMISESEADAFADSRVQNLAAIAELHSDKPTQLLRISMQSEVEDVVRYADISMQSEKETIRLIGGAAKKLGKVHKIILMVDMGDLREGIFNTDEAQIFSAAEAILAEPALEFHGIGVNLTCYGGIIPDETNLGGLLAIADKLRKRYSVPLPIVSGGNSSMLTMLEENRIPEGITQLRRKFRPRQQYRKRQARRMAEYRLLYP